MGGYLANPLAFLVHTVFSLYILAVMLRFLLQWTRADFFNPISQFLVRITQPALRPLRRLIPGVGGVDLSAVVLMVLLQGLSLALVMLVYGVTPRLGYILVRTPADLLSLLFNLYFIAIIAQAILSWVMSPGQYHPAQTLLYSLTEPVLRPIRQIVPLVGGIDLSPLVALILLQVLKMLVMQPLNSVAPPIL
ncbi:YggT family protein [Arhodomonas sp. SL1]|uniref:YggT family protein n=1 Tax=Arhodomonas sp. SL1 TaxID=3425691 RepID=UPI003F883225